MSPSQEEAIDWQARYSSGSFGPADEVLFQAWLASSAERRTAWLELQARLSKSLAPLRQTAPARLLDATPVHSRRRLLRGSLMLGGLTLGLGLLERGGLGGSGMASDLVTRTAERDRTTLVDGTVVTLDARSEVDVHAHPRGVRVRGGVVLVDVASASEPFVLNSRHATARLQAGRCLLEARAGFTRVWSLDAEVEIATSRQRLALSRGKGVAILASGVEALPGTAYHAAAWLKGFLHAQDETLGYVIERLQAYSAPLLQSSTSVAELRISGVFSLDDPDAALSALADVLPIEVHRYFGWWTRIDHA